MELRSLQYYLAVVREGTILQAAQSLHVAQPSLSRAMKELEEELGVTLFVRGNRRITLTEEGMVLRKRAEELVRLMQMTKDEVSQIHTHLSGQVNIGAGESQSFHFLSRLASQINQDHPDIRFHITSGDTEDLLDSLDNGLIDCAVLFTDIDHTLYQSIALPQTDTFGVLLPKSHPLAQKEVLTFQDLKEQPIIISRAQANNIAGTKEFTGLNIVATYNLIYNASLLVEDGLGLAITFEGLINTSGNSLLTFRKLIPQQSITGHLIWKKYQVFSPAVQYFLDTLQEQ